MKWFLAAVKKYATFSGRAQRSEYWYFILFWWLITLGLGLVDAFLVDGLIESVSSVTGAGLLMSLFAIGMLVPSIAVGVRRLHDTNRSGWWMLFGMIPLIGWLVLFIFTVQDSQLGPNRHGPNPKGLESLSEGPSPTDAMAKWVVIGVVSLCFIPVLGIVAAVAFPAYQDYTSRVKIVEALSELALFKPQFTEMAKRKDYAATLASSGISPAGGSFSSLHYDAEALILVGNLSAPFAGKSVGIQYSNAGTEWKCGSKDLQKKLLPSKCREDFTYLDRVEAMAAQKNLAARTQSPAAPVEKALLVPAVLAVPPPPPVAVVVAPPPEPPAKAPAAAIPTRAAAAPIAPKANDADAESKALAAREEQARRRARENAEAARRAPKASKSECVYKPVMTDDDIAKCR